MTFANALVFRRLLKLKKTFGMTMREYRKNRAR